MVVTVGMRVFITEDISTPREDHAELFSTTSFASYIISVLNPGVSSTMLQSDLTKPIDSIIFKFYKPGTTQTFSAKMIDPYTVSLMKDREPIDPRRVPADINEILLLDILAFIEERGLKKNEILSSSADERYIELVSNIFNDYVMRRGSGLKDIEIEKANFAKGDEFKLNIDFIPSETTRNLLKDNERLQDLFKIMLGSLRKKRNPEKVGNVLTPSVINDFNLLIDKIEELTASDESNEFKTFSDYLNLKSTNESYQTADELVFEERVLNYNDFINLGKITINEADIMDKTIENPDSGRNIKVSNALKKDKDEKVYKIAKALVNKEEKTEDESVEGSSKRVTELSNRVSDQIKNIKDPDQKENAEMVLNALNVINDPKASKEDKLNVIQQLNDDGLIARNSESAKSTKMYLNTSATGLGRKLLVPSSGSPSEITSLMKEIGLENFSPEGGKIGRKEMTAAKLFGKDSVKAVDVKVSDNGIDIGGNKIEKVEVPSDERLLEIYGDKKEADLAKKYLERRNKIVDEAIKSFQSGELTVIEPVPNTPPTTPENREKLKSATADTIVLGFEGQFKKAGTEPTKSQAKILNDFKNLKDIKDPKEYDKELHRLTEDMFKDPFFDSGTTDVVEMVTYMSELNKGNAVYMPSASNYPLGDVISISLEKIDYEKDSPEEIQRKIQLIYNGVEARSIKKNAGGASASGEKTSLSSFKEVKNSKGEVIKPEDVKNDLSELSNKDALYKDIYDGDPGKASEKIEELSKKYDFDLDDPKFKARREQSVQSAMDNILANPKCEGTDPGDLKKKLDSYFNLGNMYETLYNDNVNEQLFVNEQYKYTKTKGLEVNRTDGVTIVAKLTFAFSAGKWSCDGRPGNPVPTRFKNTKVD